MLKAQISGGGGVRIGGVFGADYQRQKMEINIGHVDYFAGVSAGGLHAAMSANGWSPKAMCEFFIDTNFARCFTPLLVPFGLRKMAAALKPISLKKLAELIDKLEMPNKYGPAFRPLDNLIVTSVDSQANKIVAFCETLPSFIAPELDNEDFYISHGGRIRWVTRAFSEIGYGTVLTRGMVLPGLRADHSKYKDGGVWQNPPLGLFPEDTSMLVYDLGYPGEAAWSGGKDHPDTPLEDAIYDFDFKAKSYAEEVLRHYPNAQVVYPGIWNVPTDAFNLGRLPKIDMIHQGADNTATQWRQIKPL